MAVCQNLVPLVNIKIAGRWMFIPLKMVLIGIDPYPYINIQSDLNGKCCPTQLPWIQDTPVFARSGLGGCKHDNTFATHWTCNYTYTVYSISKNLIYIYTYIYIIIVRYIIYIYITSYMYNYIYILHQI